MPIPAWWPEIMLAADRRRHTTGMLLACATPSLHNGVLRLQFTEPRLVNAWRDSGAQAALEGALTASGIAVAIRVTVADTALA